MKFPVSISITIITAVTALLTVDAVLMLNCRAKLDKESSSSF
jgi:hypothetical protein